MLTDAQKAQYLDEGYLVLPGFRRPEALAALRERAAAIVDAFEPQGQGTVFTTRDQARTADAYFLASADRIHCFFEEEAFGPDGTLCRPKPLAINKIGHALHDLDPVFDRFSRGADLAEVAADLGLLQPQVWQSMLIFKQPGIGGEVRWHQDASFFHTEPICVTTFWFALEDATRGNGCLWAQPGGHRGPLRERFVRAGNVVRMVALDSTPWPDQRDAQPIEVQAGTLVCFHGLLPHWSGANRSPRSRQAYTLHVTDAGCHYASDNWIQRGEKLPVRGLLP